MREHQPPRTDYTFFPDPEESEELATADPQVLARIFMHQPKMLPGFLHELWRTNRQEEMFLALQLVGKNKLPASQIFGQEMVVFLEMSHTIFRVPLDSCRDFLRETFTLVKKVYAGKAFDSQLDPESEDKLKTIVNQTLAKVTEAKQMYISRTN